MEAAANLLRAHPFFCDDNSLCMSRGAGPKYGTQPEGLTPNSGEKRFNEGSGPRQKSWGAYPEYRTRPTGLTKNSGEEKKLLKRAGPDERVRVLALSTGLGRMA